MIKAYDSTSEICNSERHAYIDGFTSTVVQTGATKKTIKIIIHFS